MTAVFFVLAMLLPVLWSGADADVSLTSSTSSELVLTYSPVFSGIDTIFSDDRAYEYFNFEDHSFDETPGAPAIPSTSIYFASPGTDAPAVDVRVAATHEAADVTLLPVPRLAVDETGLTVEAYVENPEYYAFSGFRPETYASLAASSPSGGLTVWELRLRPLLYDAAQKTVRHIERAEITVMLPSGAGASDGRNLPPHVVNRHVFSNGGARKTAARSNPFASGEWYRVTVRENGIYGISGSELGKAGFPLDSRSVNDIRMYYGGGWLLDEAPHTVTTDDFKEIAIDITDRGKAGIFDGSDTIVFYGENLSRFHIKKGRPRPRFQNHLYSTDNVFWITLSPDGTPKRIQSSGGKPDAAVHTRTTYRFIKHLEEENHLELVKGGSQWYWDGIVGQTKQYSFNAPGRVPGSPSSYRVGFLNQAEKRGHIAYVYVNDQKATPHQFSDEMAFVDHEYDGELKTEGNIINIVRKYVVGENDVTMHLDWIEIQYDRSLLMLGDFFDFFHESETGGAAQFSVGDIITASTNVYDTTDPYTVSEFDGAVFDSSSRTLTFRAELPAGQPVRFTLHNPSSLKKVVSIEKKARSDLRNPDNDENYIVIAHTRFMDAARKLAAWRSRDSAVDPLVTKAVDTRDIYDEFNWGVFDPVAIRDYFKFIWENGDPDRNYYNCIIGDTTYKYKNLTESQKGRNFVPTYSGIDQNWAITTDDFFSWFDDHRLAAFASGRLCVNNAETADAVVDKIIEYEKNPVPGLWHNNLMLIADDDLRSNGVGQEIIHSNQVEDLDVTGCIPNSIERTKLMMIEYPLKNFQKPDVTEALFSAIQEGRIIVNFVGHGNSDLLAHEHILVSSRDLERFTNGAKLPLFLVFSCSVGNFVQLDSESLSEKVHNIRDGGFMGVISATVETYSVPNFQLNVAYYENLFDRAKNPEHRIGHALLLAKRDILKSNSNRFVLFGDPASRLMIPRFDVAVADVDSVDRLQKLDLTGDIRRNGANLPYSGTLFVRARGPRIHKVYHTISNLRRIEYTQPGKMFFFGEQPLSGDSFASSFVIPKDVPSEGSETSVLFFATGGENEANGVLYDFAVGGLDRNAPDDRSGPDIQIAFDGKVYDDGDYISRQPRLTATFTDPSGINTFGNRGHNVTLVIDGKEIVILTDACKSIGSYTSTTVDYTLPILTPGEHELELNAYDTYNNAARKQVTVNVVGSETGDVAIMNLLNHPNPMGKDGTTFTFNLTDDTRSAEIKIFSQSGRLVDSIRASAGYGFNTVFWKPPFQIANGVYFYKLTVKSVNGRSASKIEKLVVMK